MLAVVQDPSYLKLLDEACQTALSSCRTRDGARLQQHDLV